MDKFIKYRIKRVPKLFQSIKEIEYKYHIYFGEDNNDIENIIVDIFNKSEIDDSSYDLEDSRILNALGLYYGRIKQDYEKEFNFFYESAKMKNIDAICNIGSLLILDGEYDRALKYFRKCEGHSHPLVDFQIGYIYHQLNDYENALKYYQNAELKSIDYESEYFHNIPVLTDYISEVQYKLSK